MQALTQVLVQTAGAISNGSATDPASVTDATIAIFDVGYPSAPGEIDISSGSPVVADYNVLQLVRGVASGELPVVTTELQVSRIKRVLKRAYRAAAAQVTTISSVPAVPTAGGVYTIRIGHTAHQQEYPHKLKSYDFRYAAGGTLDLDDIRAVINADASRIVNGTGTTTLILTAIATGEPFDVALDDLFIGSTEVLTASPDGGSGTYAQVLELEKNVKGTVAEYYVNDQILGPRPGDSFTFPPRTFAVSGELYAMYTIEYQNNFDESINRSFGHQEIILAIDADITNESEFEDFFAAILTTV